jgi:hypothetical protein
MIIKCPNSRISVVNLFADFILSKIPNEKQTIIQVVDCYNFFVIKGKTSHKDPLNISEIKDEFISKFSEFIGDRKITNTIDLIEYNSKLSKLDSFSFTYYNSDNCSYHQKQIDKFTEDSSLSYQYDYLIKPLSDNDSLIYCSEFPYGYSFDQGRLLYYYGKHIVYNIPPTYPFKNLTLTFLEESNNYDINVYDNFSEDYDDNLKSAILDTFDFDMNWLENEIKKVDWSIEITNPLDEYSFLKRITGDLIII